MEVNYFIIILTAVLVFALAPVWFGAMFGNIWNKIHGWENMSKEELKLKDAGTGKLMFVEAIGTLLMVSVLAFFTIQTPAYYEFAIAFFVWIGFVLPNTISGVIWGGDKKQHQFKKILILSGFNFIALMFSALIFSLWL